MKITRLVTLLAAMGTFMANSSVFANDRAGAFSIRLGDGYYYFTSKRNMDNSSIPNLALGYDITDNWGLQVAAAFVNTNLKGAYGGDHVHGMIYTLDGVYNFQQFGRIEPYLLGGLGIVSLKPNNNDPTSQGNVNVGAGVQYFMTDSISIGADARDLYTLSGGKNDLMLTLGISFLLGGEPAQPAATYKG